MAEQREAAPIERNQIIIVAGPCGSGKSTVAKHLSTTFRTPFIEGDELHSFQAVSKMASGIPLTDDDRAPWIDRIKRRALEILRELGYNKAIISCSALEKGYRGSIRSMEADDVQVLFLDLQVGRDELVRRMLSRGGHYMKPGMVDSQLAIYESPTAEEVDVLPVHAMRSIEEVQTEVLGLLKVREGC